MSVNQYHTQTIKATLKQVGKLGIMVVKDIEDISGVYRMLSAIVRFVEEPVV